MEDENEGLKERWGNPGHVPERAYAQGELRADPRTDEIRSDIEHTRSDMTETIDAIQEKLRPGNVVSQAAGNARDAMVGKVKQMARSARDTFGGDEGRSYAEHYGITERIRENPIPAALAAASLAWIAFSGRRSRRRMGPAIYGSTRGEAPFIREAMIAEDEHTGTGERMWQATSSRQNGVQRLMRENPLAAAAIAAVVGAGVGMTLPETRRENELMGEARDTVVNRAQEAARDAAERVQDAAQQVQDAAAKAAQKVTGET